MRNESSLTHASVEEGLGVDGHEVGGDGAHLDQVEIPGPAKKFGKLFVLKTFG